MTDQKKFDEFRKELFSYDVHNEIIRIKTMIEKFVKAIPDFKEEHAIDIGKMGQAIELLKGVERSLFNPEKFIEDQFGTRRAEVVERC